MKDYRSLEHKIRLLVEGRLTPGGWERVSNNTWVHPVAEITRTIDEDGNESFINKAGDIVELTNTEKRMKEPKVGRPDKNRLKTQTEIIRKVVDDDSADPKESVEHTSALTEKKDKDDDDKKKDKDDKKKDKPPFGKDKAKDKDETDDKDDPKKIKGGKTEVDTEPKTNDNIDAENKDEKKPKKKKEKDCKEWFTPEELDYFDAVMAEEYVDMSKKSCDEIINAKGKPHKVYTATDETRHGMGVDELKKHLGVGDSDSVHKKFMHNLHTAGVRTGWSHSAGKWIAYHGKKV